MTYDEFTLDGVMDQFSLRVVSQPNAFIKVSPMTPSVLLRETLAEAPSLALSVSTDKARSEFITAPVLAEVRRQLGRQVSLFSGVDLTVDPEAGLSGVCDFLFSLSPLQLSVQAPVVAVVEAKNDNIKSGIGQCIAELMAAQKFNARRGTELPHLFGAITTGSSWKFLRLTDTTVTLDQTEYSIAQPEQILGILVSMIREAQESQNH